MGRILVTGSEGAIGRPLTAAFAAVGLDVAPFDKAAPKFGADIRDGDAVAAAMRGCAGVCHLAALSRVHRSEEDPAECRSSNVAGTRTILEQAIARVPAPWVIFASSREVYGNPARLPARESDRAAPINAYGRSKWACERLMEHARHAGLRTAVLRLSSVYGSANDHPDRAAPAFARQAASGEPIAVTGGESLLDLVHIDDVIAGWLAAARRLIEGSPGPPTLNLASGRAISLRDLASLANRLAGGASRISETAPRPFDVRGFVGSPERAREVLGWRARVPVEIGMKRLVETFRRQSEAMPLEEVPYA